MASVSVVTPLLILISSLQVLVYSDSLIATVTKALVDPLQSVRIAAAQAFVHLHSNVGTRALEEIVPQLLKMLEDEDK